MFSPFNDYVNIAVDKCSFKKKIFLSMALREVI